MKVTLKLNTGRTYIANVPNTFTDEQVINLVNSELDLWNETVEEIVSKEIFDRSKNEKEEEVEPEILNCTDMSFGRAKRLFDDSCNTIMKYGILYVPEKYDPVFKAMWRKIDEALDAVNDKEDGKEEQIDV